MVSFIQLRHRTPSFPIYLSEAIHKPFALSRVFILSSGGKSIVLVKKKAPSRSGFHLSMYVVLKTRHVNPNIHVRRFIVHVRSPNLQATRPQLFIPARSNNRTEVTSQSYIAFFAILYSSTMHPYSYIWNHCARPLLHYSYLLPSQIGGFRLRSSKEESASCEEMALRNGLFYMPI